jgi:hypothetical protein
MPDGRAYRFMYFFRVHRVGDGWHAFAWPAREQERNQRTFAIDANGELWAARGFWGEQGPAAGARKTRGWTRAD